MKRFVCGYCQKAAERMTGEVNRALKRGLPLYCDRSCAGLARRKNKTKQQKIAEKREYDMEYRRTNRAMLKEKKAAYFRRTYDPTEAAVERKKNMARHVEYCRRPEYKAWKQDYDRKFRAKQGYGEFWESFLLLHDVEREVYSRISWYEIHLENGQLNKRNQRRKEYERTICK